MGLMSDCVWNRSVEESKASFRQSTPENNTACGPAKLANDLTQWPNDNEWLANTSSVTQQQTI
ncbi:unnamed protein product [Acidithrix sp. C25]|nr:unnamed protein product [Acidithrix sp. C25]